MLHVSFMFEKCIRPSQVCCIVLITLKMDALVQQIRKYSSMCVLYIFYVLNALAYNVHVCTCRYRHSLSELYDLVSRAQLKANMFCVWSDKVDKLLDGFESPKPDIEFMKSLKVEAEGQSLTQCEQYQELCATITEAERLQKDVYRLGRKDKYALYASGNYMLVHVFEKDG